MFGHGNEGTGRHRAAFGMSPPQQCFDRTDLLVREAKERLEHHVELTGRQAGQQVGFQLEALVGHFTHA